MAAMPTCVLDASAEIRVITGDPVDQIEPDRHLQVEALALACHLDHPVYGGSAP